jgi:hypothetical protein
MRPKLKKTKENISILIKTKSSKFNKHLKIKKLLICSKNIPNNLNKKICSTWKGKTSSNKSSFSDSFCKKLFQSSCSQSTSPITQPNPWLNPTFYHTLKIR